MTATRYRFCVTLSGRLYVAYGNSLWFYDRDELAFAEVSSKDRSVAELIQDERTQEVESEDDFPYGPRRTFRTQFEHDSRLASQFNGPSLPLN